MISSLVEAQSRPSFPSPRTALIKAAEGLLCQEPLGAGVPNLLSDRRIVMHGQADDGDLRHLLTQLPRRIHPVEPGHAHVHQDHVRLKLPSLLQSGEPVTRLTYIRLTGRWS